MVAKVVIDFSVLGFAMEEALRPLMTTPSYNELNSQEQTTFLENVVGAQMEYLSSLMFMGDDRPEEYQLIFVSDNKISGRYWRHDYLEREDVIEQRRQRVFDDYDARVLHHLESKDILVGYKGRKPRKPTYKAEIAYKGGRKEVGHFQSLLRVVMKGCIQQHGWSFLGVRGYEADDIAATLVHLNNGKDAVYLLTVDTDWLGLIGDNVTWFCTSGYAPRLRYNVQTLNIWAQHRLKTVFDSPSDLWVHKALYGDACDNLPPFSPIEVIDLLNPPDAYKLWLNPLARDMFSAVLNENHNDATLSIPAVSYLNKMRMLGIRPVIVNTQ